MAQIWGDASLRNREGWEAFEYDRDMMGTEYRNGKHYLLVIYCFMWESLPLPSEVHRVVQKILTDLSNG